MKVISTDRSLSRLQGAIVVLIATIMLSGIAPAQTFSNPLFNGADPWVTYVGGEYYYTANYCGIADICLKESSTLQGLSSAPWIALWSHSTTTDTLNIHDIWAPEIHYINGKWYVYYAADDGNNSNHHLFALTPDPNGTGGPTGPFVEAATGLTDGELDESTGNWAIDPDVFQGADNSWYITFSCTNQHSSASPQRICVAPMTDPLHLGTTVFLSTPTAYWEIRTAAIQEGPVGYTRDGHTYITYSGSASWVPSNYAVGLLTLASGTSPLTASNWTKSGPIFDNHGANANDPNAAWGAGSVVFVPSLNGDQYWVVYHTWNQNSDCSNSPSPCHREVHMQQMYFDPVGYPILGYPVNRDISLAVPSGEGEVTGGGILVPDFGNAFGDAAEGNNMDGLVTGPWTWTDRYTATSSTGGPTYQIFSPWNPNVRAFTSRVMLQLVNVGTTSSFPKYGMYCVYNDHNNHAEMYLDPKYKVLATHAVVNGTDEGWQNTNLPDGFVFTDWHTFACTKGGSATDEDPTFIFQMDGKTLQTRTLGLVNGQAGLIEIDTKANYKGLDVQY